jgi:hypothetical protein
LAEGQKSADVKRLLVAPPPSASQLELAEWVKFPEKNEDLVISKRHLAERGALLQNAYLAVSEPVAG